MSESGGVDAVNCLTQSRKSVIVAGAHMEIAPNAHWGLDRRRNGPGVGRQRCRWIGDGDFETCAAPKGSTSGNRARSSRALT